MVDLYKTEFINKKNELLLPLFLVLSLPCLKFTQQVRDQNGQAINLCGCVLNFSTSKHCLLLISLPLDVDKT